MPTYRCFSRDDLDACAALYLKVFSAAPWHDRWASLGHVKEYLLEYVNNPVFLGYVAAGKDGIAGACLGHLKSWWSGKELYLDELFVDQEHQGKGIGSGLLAYIKSDLQARGVNVMTLLTEKGLPAEGFYLHNGFCRKDALIFMYCHFSS